MNENDLARRIVGRLDHGLDELPASTLERLRAARVAALGRLRPETAPGPARFFERMGVRLALPVAIVIASITGLLYWQMSSPHEEELDAGMLAGELPIHAYIDPGFDTWLRHTSHTPQR
jgi:hypothetical protein